VTDVTDAATKILSEDFADTNSIQVIGDPPIYPRIPQKNDKKPFRVKINNYLKIIVSPKDVAVHMNGKSPCDNRQSSKFFAEILDELIRLFPQKQAEIDFLPTCIDKTNHKETDDLFVSTIRSEMKHLDSFLVKRFRKPLDIMGHFKDTGDFCIYILLHSLILAFITNRKYLAISYHPEVRYFAGDHALKSLKLSDMPTNPDNIIKRKLQYPDDELA
jgi:polysaccharide pyruvyl transferase WcaK-like protein